MELHRYTLEPYKGMDTRHHCPACQVKEKTFSRYIDTVTGNYLADNVGRCNRESNCGYHYTPKQYFQDNNIPFEPVKPAFIPKPVIKKTSLIPIDIFKESFNHEANNFIRFLLNLFGPEITKELIKKYFIGTSNHWPGSVIYWQIDLNGKIRTGKIMLYNSDSGKRVKEPINYITWVHKALKLTDFSLNQCFFGEHLLKEKNKPVAIVESEKTAIISSVYLPQFIWLAAGGLDSLNIEKCKVLTGRSVILFPDLKGFDKWNDKVKELSHLTTFKISKLLEEKASPIEKEKGFDLADYLIKFDFRDFSIKTPKTPEVQPLIRKQEPEIKTWLNGTKKENWQNRINELEYYFNSTTLPNTTIKLNPHTSIFDISKFIESDLLAVKSHNGNRHFLPALERLEGLRRILTLSTN